MDVDKKRWRQWWLESLLSLADIELQKERWLNKEIKNPHWSYVEFRCCYFDDCLFEDYAGLIKKRLVQESEYNCIKQFHQALEEYSPPNVYDHQAILEDKKWHELTALGQVSLKKLEALITDEAEQDIFTKRLYVSPLTAGDFSWPLPPQ